MESQKYRNTSSTSADYNNNKLRSTTTVLENRRSFENKMTDRKRSIGLYSRNNMAVDFGSKSRPVSTRRGTPIGWDGTRLELGGSIKVLQSQVYLQAPDGQVLPRRGLSGSKIRKSSANSAPGGPTLRNAYVSELKQVQSIPTSPKPFVLRLNPRLFNSSKRPLPIEDGSQLSGSSYSWNTSDQGLRLQRELSQLSFRRAQKEASRGESSRKNPMYCLYGSGVSLLNRHGADDGIMDKPQDVNGEALDGKKTKLKYDSRASSSKLQALTPRPGVNVALAHRVNNGTGREAGHNSIDGKIALNEIHRETESKDLHQETECNDLNQETESKDLHQETESSDLRQETESNDLYQETESNDLNQETEFSDLHQEEESNDLNQETESNDLHKEIESKDLYQETEPNDLHQET